jgi:hypothetical protein
MPETAVYQNRYPVFRKNDVRLPRKSPILHPEPESSSKKSLPNQNFRLGILSPYPGHAASALFWTQLVRHKGVMMNITKIAKPLYSSSTCLSFLISYELLFSKE